MYRQLPSILALSILASPSVAEIVSETSISPMDYRLEIALEAQSLRSGRSAAIDELYSHLISSAGTSLTETDIEKVLTLDEGFADNRYDGSFRVLSTQPMTALSSDDVDPFYDTPVIQDVVRPEWVLVVPMIIDDDQRWQIVDRKNSWPLRWKIPFLDNVTQFIPATIDHDDVTAASEATDFFDVSDYLSERYNAAHIMFVAKSTSNEVLVAAWHKDASEIPTEFAVWANDDLSLTELRTSTLETYWSLLTQTSEPNIPTAEHQAAIHEDKASPQNIDVYNYTILGTPIARREGGIIFDLSVESEEPEVIATLIDLHPRLSVTHIELFSGKVYLRLIGNSLTENEVRTDLEASGFIELF